MWYVVGLGRLRRGRSNVVHDMVHHVSYCFVVLYYKIGTLYQYFRGLLLKAGVSNKRKLTVLLTPYVWWGFRCDMVHNGIFSNRRVSG